MTYLNTATLGLPPRRGREALTAALRDWAEGTAEAVGFDADVEAARASYAALVGAEPGTVAVGSQVSVMVGLVAANLPPGAEVLCADGDFTSVLFPLLAQTARGVQVQTVPLTEIAAAVGPSTDLVAVSAVQSADGRVADLPALRDAATACNARVLLDVTQAVGWLLLRAGDWAYTVCGGYKWLSMPRGAAFLTIGADSDLVPYTASWYAGADRWSSIYGGPLRLAADARRFDVSPAWHAWVGGAPALALLAEVGVPALHAHSVGLANRFRAGTGLPAAESAIVSVAVADEAAGAMRAAKVVGAARAGRLRLAFHLPNDEADVDRALDVLSPYLR